MLSANDKQFLQMAIDLSLEGMNSNSGGPFGAVIVKDNEVVGKGFNRVTSTNDPTAHAEVVAIRDACKNLSSFQLEGCTIYSSCEPCPMCLGAIYWARPNKLIFACSRTDAASIGFDDDYIYQEINLSAQERTIPTVQGMQAEGYTVMKQWLDKSEKEEY